MKYEVGESATHPGYYSAEAVNHEGDGEIYVVLFLGPNSRARAELFVRTEADTKRLDWLLGCGIVDIAITEEDSPVAMTQREALDLAAKQKASEDGK